MAEKKKKAQVGLPDIVFYPILLFFFALLTPFFYYSVMSHLWFVENSPEDFVYPKPMEIITVTAAGSVFYFTLDKVMHALFYEKMRRDWCKPQATEELTARYAEKAVASLVKAAHFTTSVVWGYALLKDCEWLPPILLGQNPNASLEKAYAMDFTSPPPGLVTYLQFTSGYHMQGFLDHLLLRERASDFREMLLHHIATVALYPGFQLANLMGVGAIVAWLHDISDVFVAISRALNSVGWDKCTAVTYTALMLSWVWTRVGVLPVIVYALVLGGEGTMPQNPYHAPWLRLEMTFLSALLVLHVYWFYMLAQMGYRLLSKGQVKDTVNDLAAETGDKKQD